MEILKMTTTQVSKSDKIRAYIAKHPTATASVVAKKTDSDVSLVYTIKKQQRKASSTGDTLPQVAQQTKVEAQHTEETVRQSRYSDVVDLIRVLNLNFNLGSALAHICILAGECTTEEKIEELESALWYIKKEAQAIKAQ